MKPPPPRPRSCWRSTFSRSCSKRRSRARKSRRRAAARGRWRCWCWWRPTRRPGSPGRTPRAGPCCWATPPLPPPPASSSSTPRPTPGPPNKPSASSSSSPSGASRPTPPTPPSRSQVCWPPVWSCPWWCWCWGAPGPWGPSSAWAPCLAACSARGGGGPRRPRPLPQDPPSWCHCLPGTPAV